MSSSSEDIKPLNRYLAKQLKRIKLDDQVAPDAARWRAFLARLSDALDSQAENKYLMERAMLISSDEMRDLASQLQARNTALEKEVAAHNAKSDELHYRATHDMLTGLPSRQVLLERITAGLERIRCPSEPGFAALFLDLDRFKQINDTLGHASGDQVLTVIAKLLGRIAETFSEQEVLVSRIGGDEFVVLVQRVSDRKKVEDLATVLCSALKEPLRIGLQPLRLGASIGVAFGGPEHCSGDDVLRDADIAMYAAKSAGKGQFAVFDQAMRRAVVERVEIEQGLRRALEEGHLRVHYQPKVDLATGRIEGFEALVRWFHPEQGMISPDRFIPLAEDTGLIVEVGEWVLRQACKDLRRWQETVPGFDAKMKMAVNLSRVQMTGVLFARQLLDVIADEGLEPPQIAVEVTERAVAADPEGIIETIRTLRDNGVEVHIDDFGVGESSFGSLHSLPLDVVKIDRMFSMDNGAMPALAATTQAIVALAHQLELRVVAEGVETAERARELRACGCDQAQGYYFSKPVDAQAVARMLRGGRYPWQREIYSEAA